MGVIQIRRSQAGLGNLPNVRKVDTSGLATSSARGLATLGEGISSGLINATTSLGHLAEFKTREKERAEAKLKAEQEAERIRLEREKRLKEQEDSIVVSDAVVAGNKAMFEYFHDQGEAITNSVAVALSNVKDKNALASKAWEYLCETVGFDQMSPDQQKIFRQRTEYDIVTKSRAIYDASREICDNHQRSSAKAEMDVDASTFANNPNQQTWNLYFQSAQEVVKANKLSPSEAKAFLVGEQLKAAEVMAKTSIQRASTLPELEVLFHSIKALEEPRVMGVQSDGTFKEIGYFGELKAGDGSIVTDYPIEVDFVGDDGKTMTREIPLFSPNLTKDELSFLLDEYIPADDATKTEIEKGEMYTKIRQKAVDYATPLINRDQSPFYQGPFGPLSDLVSQLPEAMRLQMIETVSKAVDARKVQIQEEQAAQRANLEKARKDTVTGFKIQLEEGELDYESLDVLFNQAIDGGWSNDNVLAIQTLRNEAKEQRINREVANVTLNPSNYVKTNEDGALIFENIPQYVLDDPKAKLRLYNAYELGYEQEKALRDGAIEAMLDTIVFSRGAFGDTIEQREEAIRKLAREGHLTYEKANDTIKVLNQVYSDRLRPVLDEIALESPYFSMVALTEGADGSLVPNIDATYKAFVSKFGKSGGVTSALTATRKYVDIWKDFHAWAEAHPNATDEELKNAFNLRAKTMLPILSQMDVDSTSWKDLKSNSPLIRYIFMNAEDPHKKIFKDSRFNNPNVRVVTTNGITTVQPSGNNSDREFVDAWIGGEHLTTKPSKEDDDETNVQ